MATVMNLQLQLSYMLRRRVHIGPSFQLGKLLRNPIRNQRRISPHTLLIRDRIPIVRGVGIPIWTRKRFFGDIKHRSDGGREDKALEGRIISGGLEDGERSEDCGFDYSFGESGT